MTSDSESSIVRCPNCGKQNRVRRAAPAVPHCGVCGKPLPWLVDADEASFRPAVEESPLPVLIEFWAPWCGPCRMVAPVVEQISRDLAGRLKVVKVDSDLAPALSQRFNVLGIPALIFFDAGQERDRLTGAPPAAALRNWVDSRLATHQRR